MSRQSAQTVEGHRDLRQGVTKGEHLVLSLVDVLPRVVTPRLDLEEAFALVRQARTTTSSGVSVVRAREAAARLIRYAQASEDYLARLKGGTL